MKRVIITVLLVFSCLMLVGCGNKLSSYSGTYILEYFKYVGDPDDAKNNTNVGEIILESDGTGKSNRDGFNYDIKWSLDEDNITLTEIYYDNEIEYFGTLKDNRLVLYDGDINNSLTIMKVYIKK